MQQKAKLNVPKKAETVLQWQTEKIYFQVFVDIANKQSICTAHAKSKKHDFTLFKSSRTHLLPGIVCLADIGYQGIAKLHPNSYTPKKKPRGGKLTVEDKHSYSAISSTESCG